MERRIYINRWILFCIYIFKKHGKKINNVKIKPSVKVDINDVENRITFKVKDGYSLELLAKEKMKLLGSTENKITKNKNGEMYRTLKVQK